MADAGGGLDAGPLRFLGAAEDEPCAAAGDEQVDQAGGGHKLPRAGAVRILDESNHFRREARVRQTQMNGVRYGGVGTESLLAAAQYRGVAGLEREDRRVGGDVRAALIDDGDDAQRDGGWALYARQHLSHRIRQADHFADAFGHTGDALGIQGQTVYHNRTQPVTGCRDVFSVGSKDAVLLAY